MDFTTSRGSRAVEKTFGSLAAARYNSSVLPSQALSNRCGNICSGSLFGGLASLLTAIPWYDLFDKRISMFAYGSGCASSFFVVRVRGDTRPIAKALDLTARLSAIDIRPCSEYVTALKVRVHPLSIGIALNFFFSNRQLREANRNAPNHKPVGSMENLWPGSYYLKSIDIRYRRSYNMTPIS